MNQEILEELQELKDRHQTKKTIIVDTDTVIVIELVSGRMLMGKLVSYSMGSIILETPLLLRPTEDAASQEASLAISDAQELIAQFITDGYRESVSYNRSVILHHGVAASALKLMWKKASQEVIEKRPKLALSTQVTKDTVEASPQIGFPSRRKKK
jgi:hypothetical protein